MAKALFSYTFIEDFPSKITFTNLTPLEEGGTIKWIIRDNAGKDFHTATDQSITVDFSTLTDIATGLYKVTLRVDDGSGTEATNTMFFYDNSTQVVTLHFSIWEQVRVMLGEGLVMTPPEYIRYRDIWQEILAAGLEIADTDIHNEIKWPLLANSLIGYLIVRDFVTSGANKMLASTSGSDTAGGGVKRVETGPVNTEWFPEGSAYKTVFETGGLWEQVTEGICRLATALTIYIDGCPQSSRPVIIPKVLYSGSYIYEEQMMYGGQFTRK